MYHRYMFVSERHEGASGDGGPGADVAVTPEVEGLLWLQQQLAWEAVLNRLRQEAGVGPAAGEESPSASAA